VLSGIYTNHDDMGVVTEYVDGFYSPMHELPQVVPPADTAANLWRGVHSRNKRARRPGEQTSPKPELFYNCISKDMGGS